MNSQLNKKKIWFVINPISGIGKQKTVEKIPEKKSYIPLTQKKQENPKDMGWLFEDRSMYEKENSTVKRTKGASAGKDIKELYGDDFGKLSAGQQEYILDNIKNE